MSSDFAKAIARWAPGMIFDMVALDCSSVKCNAPKHI